ncbi:hypothetical protein [Actinomadura sp. HBU206391]|uniref:hypothetical protein n=1 Tax=Actinomadura sp. HBU206391 TaxID=2731692 RepID=UPI001650A9E1|nr:hypothetical protein [Actinomadura sp. HBU206391]MBC6457181.1 hypothetical protein [Actinomadura sp. HBU206391]
MTASDTSENLDLAASAREIADGSPSGSVQKAAAGSVAVTCATTRSLDEARTVLSGVKPEPVRQAALDLLDRLSVGG